MNRIAAIALSVAATLMAAGSAMAQNRAVEVTVPFSFTVNNTTLPAGSYSIASDPTHPNTLVVRDRTGSVKAVNVGISDASSIGKTSTLIFHRYGSQYFLSEIRFASANSSLYFPANKQELRARKQLKKEGFESVATS